MSLRPRRMLLFGGLGLLGLILTFLFIDYRERVALGETVQQELLGRVIATRESLVWMHPGFLPADGGGTIWIYRLEPGQFASGVRHCIEPLAPVDNSGQRNAYLRENTQECMLSNRLGDFSRSYYQIVLGDSTLWVAQSNP